MNYLKVKPLQIFLKENRLVFLVLAGVIFLAFANSINNEFISDDISAIVHNPNLGSFSKTIQSSLFGLIPNLNLSIIFHLVGNNPSLFHINNIIWHLGTTVLVYFIIFLISKQKSLALVTSLFFALHPIHTENVTWISGQSYIVYTFFSLLALLIYILIDKGIINQKFIIAISISAALAFLSSFHAIVLPVILVLYAVSFSSFKKMLKTLWPIFLVSLIFGISFIIPLAHRVSDFGISAKGNLLLFNPFIKIPIALITYLKLLIVPVDLTLYHEYFRATTPVLTLYILITILLLTSCIFFYKKNRFIFFGEMLFLIALSPTLLPISITWLVAERYVYLGSLGIIMIISYLILFIKSKSPPIFWVLFVFILISYFFLTVKRNSEWRNQDTLWPVTVAVSPGSTLAHNNMGDYYARHGDLKSALIEFGKSVALKPDNADAIHNLGFTYMQMGESTKAAELFNMALSYNPNLVESVIGLYTIDMQEKKYDRAKADLQYAVKISPNSPLIYNVLALQLLDNGKKEEAIKLFNKALELDPNYLPAKQNLEIISRQ